MKEGFFLSKINQPENGYYFYKLPKILLNNDEYRECLDILDILVYTLLMDRYNQFIVSPDQQYINKNGEMFIIYPEQEIANILNKNVRFISESISKLNNIGLIKVNKVKKYPRNKDNKEMINHYYLYDLNNAEINQVEIEKIKTEKKEKLNKKSESAKVRERKKKKQFKLIF